MSIRLLYSLISVNFKLSGVNKIFLHGGGEWGILEKSLNFVSPGKWNNACNAQFTLNWVTTFQNVESVLVDRTCSQVEWLNSILSDGSET